jgi:hypothetical protein
MLRVIGAGLPRTGTLSLKPALEQLLGAPCYHGTELGRKLEHVPIWREAIAGGLPVWDTLLSGYAGTADWPASLFWRELSEAYPDALVLLSVRDSAATWWKSFDATILTLVRNELPPIYRGYQEMLLEILPTRMTPDWQNPEAMMAAYERRNAEVRATIPPERLLVWQAGDGWAPICGALGLEVPPVKFPEPNSRANWSQLLAGFGVFFD